jgi:hypothetical protein
VSCLGMGVVMSMGMGVTNGGWGLAGGGCEVRGVRMRKWGESKVGISKRDCGGLIGKGMWGGGGIKT